MRIVEGLDANRVIGNGDHRQPFKSNVFPGDHLANCATLSDHGHLNQSPPTRLFIAQRSSIRDTNSNNNGEQSNHRPTAKQSLTAD